MAIREARKMREIRQIRDALREWSKNVEVLPAAGGALEDLLHPDVEEQKERAYSDETIFDTIFERSDEGEWWRESLYRPTPPVARNQRHLFRYFWMVHFALTFSALSWRVTAVHPSTTLKLALVAFYGLMMGQCRSSS
ncbi:MAG: hypothetical protein ACK40X_08625 [Armatimonadota bacterium]